jgi:heme exporter protein C
MKHWWWKFLAITLLLAASITALRTPLAPSLVHVSPGRIAPGDVTVEVTGYNTGFNAATRVVLRNAGQTVCADEVDVRDATHLSARFSVPEGLRAEMTDLLVDDLAYSGAFFTSGTGSGNVDTGCTPPSATTVATGFAFPNRTILYESIRNLHFHVPMWFTMIALMALAMVRSIRFLRNERLDEDRAAVAAVHAGLLFCALGLVTGMIWARATWTAFWTNDVKLNGAAVTALIYLAYLVLRGSVNDPHKRARLAAIYNIFAFMMLVMFLFVVPRLNAVDSLHPGNGGNSPFSDLDLDNRLRLVFYPAVAGWILLGLWIQQLHHRTMRLQATTDR